MRGSYRVSAVMAVVSGLAVTAAAQEQAEKAADDAAIIVASLEDAMTPGASHQKLEFLVGTFDVKVRTWVDPSEPPIESTATSVATWVLGKRYVQQMLSGYLMGEPWNGIGYVGFDNTTKQYVVTYMDTGSTGMEWYTGTMDAAGKVAKLTATIHDEVTGTPVPLEMRVSIAGGEHVTELWHGDSTGKLVKVMELHFTPKKS